MHINLRSIKEVDFDFIYNVTKAAMQSYVELTWGSWVDNEQRVWIYASIDLSTHRIIQFEGKDVGCLAIEYYPSHIQLTKLYLLPNFQRYGIGTFILRQLITEAKEKEKPLQLRVLAVNPARKLYEREGFIIQAQTNERIYMKYGG
ncbi:hypothetical protein FACHB389_13480 [Nostoc calcicola FACHB-389]|nr:GNAT family N-acetyltransferase [Nostoc sp. EkiNYC01]OKH35049.1 hypothetical protein FACHB389_13480 [Nostoc calcicola FACHB-389]